MPSLVGSDALGFSRGFRYEATSCNIGPCIYPNTGVIHVNGSTIGSVSSPRRSACSMSMHIMCFAFATQYGCSMLWHNMQGSVGGLVACSMCLVFANSQC